MDEVESFLGKSGNAKPLLEAARPKFVQKVLAIVAIQLLGTIIMSGLVMHSQKLQLFYARHSGLFIFLSILAVVIEIVLVCIKTIARKVPINYILLMSFTFCESAGVSFICMQYETKSVIFALFLTFGIVLSLAIYSFTTKSDFTIMGSAICILGWALFGFGILSLFFKNEFMYNLYLVGGIILFSCYLIYDLQLIIGGKRCELSLDDYILAAMMLYIDIIVLFIKILELFGKKKDKKDEK